MLDNPAYFFRPFLLCSPLSHHLYWGFDPTDANAPSLLRLKAHPHQYEAIFFQTDMRTGAWPEAQQSYTLVKRNPANGVHVPPSESVTFTWISAVYTAIQHKDEVPLTAPDIHTDGVLNHYQGYRLGQPLRPGRGDGIADVPGLSIMGDIDPNDIAQGGVGDCWLLSAISALAEFDGAIAKVFEMTHNHHGWNRTSVAGGQAAIDQMPHDEENSYVVSLYDLPTWEPVHIEIDERLCANAQGTGLLSALPSHTGELWVCYLEKAIAAHCGGWDKLDGGQCTHAWSLILGCKETYTIHITPGDSEYSCWSKFNPNEQKWEMLGNSPHDGFQGNWPSAWPKVGGGGDMHLRLNENDLFERMCEWDDHNFIMAAGTKSGSDSESTDGVVDGHAYTVLECVNDVAGTTFDLIKVRNPWGKGEFESGNWDDDGPGWVQYPQVKAALNPVVCDDGIFWVDKDEFFKYFKTLYLCAKDMSEFVQD